MGVCPRQLEQSVQWAWEASQLFTDSEAQERPLDAKAAAGDPAELPLKTSSQAVAAETRLWKGCSVGSSFGGHRRGQASFVAPGLSYFCGCRQRF